MAELTYLSNMNKLSPYSPESLPAWKMEVKAVLAVAGLAEALKGKLDPVQDAKAWGIIALSVEDTVRTQLVTSDDKQQTAKELLDAIERDFANKLRSAPKTPRFQPISRVNSPRPGNFGDSSGW